jgi:hypothetical protein
MNKNILLLFTILAFNGFSQGLILDSDEYKKTQQWIPDASQGYAAENMPSRVSFRKYAPPIQSQGKVATCVGWAVSYAQFSTQQNLQMGITNETQKICRAMDPYFVYGYISSYGDKWCQDGTRISDAMLVLLNKGSKPFIWDPWLTCNSTSTFSEFTTALASNYTINDYLAVPSDDMVKNVKLALANQLIVSVGVNLTKSFEAGSASTYGVWAPAANEASIGGHAMCVVGYDDTKYGGAFEVMNSWGTGYGEKGFVWIKYKDFSKYVMEAYIIETPNFQKGKCSMGDCYNSYSRFTYDDGTVYEGVTVDGMPDVYGSIIYPNGDFYVGGINKGRKNGYGIYYDLKLKSFFNVQFRDDTYLRGEVKLGYASEEETKLEQLLDVLMNMSEGSQIEDDLDKTNCYFQDFEVPEQPMRIEKSGEK